VKDIGDPIFQAAILPLAAAFVLTGLLRAAGREVRGRILAGGAVAIAFLIAYLVLLGLPDWSPVDPIDKVAYIALGALVIGAVTDLIGLPVQIKYALILVIPLFGLAWVAEPQIRESPGLIGLLTLVLLFAANGVATYRLTLHEGSDITPSVYLGAGAAGLGLIGLFADANPLYHLAFALAAATVGFALWNWPVNRFAPSATLLVGAGSILVGLAGSLVLYSGASRVAMVALILVFFSDKFVETVRLGSGRVGTALRPLAVVLASAVIVLASAAIGFFIGAATETF
jgi:hypothetical protein